MPFAPGWNSVKTPAGRLQIGAYFDDMGRVLGQMQGLCASMQSPNSTATMVKYTWATLANEFDKWFNTLSRTDAKKYHHVYEWGEIGLESGRLWRHHLSGAGGMRVGSFTFVSSVKAIPKPDTSGWTEAAVEEYEKYGLDKKRYVFRDKAEIMEAGMPVSITHRNGDKIFIPLPNPRFESNNVGYVWSYRAYDPHPGGEGVVGSFTSAWETFWNTDAHVLFDEKIAPMLESQIEEIALPSGSTIAPLGVRTSTVRSFELSVADGMAISTKEVTAMMSKLSAQTKALERRVELE